MTCLFTTKTLCDNNNCNICFNKSFASHEKSKYFNIEKNNNINPRNIFKNSHNKYFFNCNICEHIFQIQLNNINTGQFCPYCANKKLCESNNCKICYNKSFESHEKSKLFNIEKNNNINPRNIFKNSHNKYFFNCNLCEHIFQLRLNNINKNNFCPYCSNPP
jgi:hypothetical protein